MFFRLLLLFTITPAVELYLLIELGQWIGAGQTVLIILLTGGIGAALAKREGFAILRQINAEAQAGFPTGDRLVEGLLVFIGGLLLLTPGVLTDLLGLLLLLPPSRRYAAPRLKRILLARVQLQGVKPGPEEPHRVSGGDEHFEHPTF